MQTKFILSITCMFSNKFQIKEKIDNYIIKKYVLIKIIGFKN